MRRSLLLPIALVLAIPFLAQSPDRDRAQAMVKEGIAFLKANGREAFLAEVHKATGRFHVKAGSTLYLFVYDLKGVVLAHGARANLLGINRWEVKGPDGIHNVQEIIKTGLKKGGGWADMKVENPETRKIEDKTSFCLAEGDLVVGCGVYK